jgi:hypothetical protein
MGWRAYRLAAGEPASWEPLPGNEIGNEHYRIGVDPSRGGGVTSLLSTGRVASFTASPLPLLGTSVDG